ncbi:hypothetical protein [Galactobacillus timonensis]|uniref:hypothetical protein n=1 Tax=Galactobacillus timonensis TaxID=2041840 RepID=UPI001083FF3B|nr:hypothetical protein [Galactobacillus timonensis]
MEKNTMQSEREYEIEQIINNVGSEYIYGDCLPREADQLAIHAEFDHLTDEEIEKEALDIFKGYPKKIHVTLKNLADALKRGETLADMLPVVAGQECNIVKLSDEQYEEANSADIVYIPDLNLHEIPYFRPVTIEEADEILQRCYTKQDFIDATFGVKDADHYLFEFVDWQTPNLQDLLEVGLGDENMENELQSRMNQKKNEKQFNDLGRNAPRVNACVDSWDVSSQLFRRMKCTVLTQSKNAVDI